MSWERDKYEAVRRKCGHEGFVISASDDWGRTSTSWVGFTSKAPHPTAVARMKVGRDDYGPVCECGSEDVVRGEYLGECDYKGDLFNRQARPSI